MHFLKETSVENKSAQSKECNDVKNEGSLTSIYTMVLEISHSKVRNTSKLDVAILWVFSLHFSASINGSLKLKNQTLAEFQVPHYGTCVEMIDFHISSTMIPHFVPHSNWKVWCSIQIPH